MKFELSEGMQNLITITILATAKHFSDKKFTLVDILDYTNEFIEHIKNGDEIIE